MIKKTVIIYLIAVMAVLAMSGCEQTLRKAPTEELRQAAQIQTDVADQVFVAGCEPGSETALLLKESAEAAQKYIGFAKAMPEDRFATVRAAKENAYDPVTIADVTSAADKWVTVAEAVLTPELLGAFGLAGFGVAGWIRQARQTIAAGKQLSAVEAGASKFMAQANAADAAKLYADIEGKKGKLGK